MCVACGWTVTYRITDDGTVASAIVTLLNQTSIMGFNSTTGLFEAGLSGPAQSGAYPVVVEAADNDNNSAKGQGLFVLDLDAPLITILSPTNSSYTTNRINLSFFANEASNQSYFVDSGPAVPVNNSAAFTLVNVPLTLFPGNHTITVFATDVFGNSGSKSASFSIDSASVQLSQLSLPLFAQPGHVVLIGASFSNTLSEPLTNVAVQLLVDGNVSEEKLFNISGETSMGIEFSLLKNSGRFNLTLQAVPPPGERFTEDNSLSAEILVTDEVPLLLVDDDPAANDSAYRQAIISAGGLGYDFVSFEVAKRGVPSLDLLSQFRAVVWFSGGEITITPLEATVLQDYLASRGYLMFFSSSAGSQLATTDFYREFLFAEFRRPGKSLTVEGTFRDQIGRGLLFGITEPGDELRPRQPATQSLRYSGGEGAAIKADNGTFKTAYFTFGLEDIIDAPTRDTIMERTLDFFDIDFTAPLITNAVPLPGTSFPINTTNVTLSLQTNEQAECRKSNTAVGFGEMTPFDSTSALQHSTLVTNLTNGKNHTFLATCSDLFGNENSAEFTFFVHNRTFFPPVLQPVADIAAFENQAVIIKINSTDPENDVLSFALEDVETVGFVPIASRFSHASQGNSTFTFLAGFNDSGTYRLRAVVSDGFGDVSEEFSLNLINVNRAPVLTPIGSKVLVEDSFFFLDVEGQDPDGDNIIFSDNATFFDITPFNGIITLTPKGADVGNHSINITVSDGGLADSEVVQFSIVNSNDAPVISPMLPQKVPEGTLFTFQVQATDPDSDPLSFSDDTSLFNITLTGLINFTPTNSDVGAHFIHITATDSLANDTKLLNLVVSDVNQPPQIISAPGTITVVRNQSFDINVTACDPDVDAGCP